MTTRVRLPVSHPALRDKLHGAASHLREVAESLRADRRLLLAGATPNPSMPFTAFEPTARDDIDDHERAAQVLAECATKIEEWTG